MTPQLKSKWFAVRSSLWFLPGLFTVFAVALASVTVRIDKHLAPDHYANSYLLFGAGAEGARGVLSAIAGSLITVTGLVFSITIVALQLASSQYSPRLFRTFTGDRGNQIVLATFIATFTFALLVLRTVRSESQDQEVFVPALSVNIAIGLTLLSICCLIYYLHHATRSMQVDVIISNLTRDTRTLIHNQHHAPRAPGADSGVAHDAEPAHIHLIVTSESAGFVQDIAPDEMLDLRRYGIAQVRILVPIGAFVMVGEPIAELLAATDDHLALPDKAHLDDLLRAAVITGGERTMMKDVMFGFRQLSDIALRALSPGINDPATALNCIDRLGELIEYFGTTDATQPIMWNPQHDLSVLVKTPTLVEILDVSFAQIRHYGSGDAIVMSHLVAVLGRVYQLINEMWLADVYQFAVTVIATANKSLPLPHDIDRVASAAHWMLEAEQEVLIRDKSRTP